MAFMWLNGTVVDEKEARLSPFDRGFTLADGVFETLRAHGTTPLWFADHLARLKAGAGYLGMPLTHDDGAIEAGILELLQKAGHAQSAVRLTLTRGPSTQRGLWPPGEPVRPTLMATVAPLTRSPLQRLIVARTTRRNRHSPLSRIKSLNYGDNLLARREALERGASEALMLNDAANVVCATIGNVFFRIDRRWTTPPPSEGLLPGLARKRLINVMNAVESVITEQLLHAADAALISNSLGCTVAIDLEGRPLADVSGEVDFASIYCDG